MHQTVEESNHLIVLDGLKRILRDRAGLAAASLRINVCDTDEICIINTEEHKAFLDRNLHLIHNRRIL